MSFCHNCILLSHSRVSLYHLEVVCHLSDWIWRTTFSLVIVLNIFKPVLLSSPWTALYLSPVSVELPEVSALTDYAPYTLTPREPGSFPQSITSKCTLTLSIQGQLLGYIRRTHMTIKFGTWFELIWYIASRSGRWEMLTVGETFSMSEAASVAGLCPHKSSW